MFGLLLPVECVEGPRWTVGEKRWELLRLKLLLDAVELTAAGRHCRRREKCEKLYSTTHKHYSSNVGINLLISPLHCQVILLWQVAPGLLKSQAAQVASSTIADGCKSGK